MCVYRDNTQCARRGRASGRGGCIAFGSGEPDATFKENTSECCNSDNAYDKRHVGYLLSTFASLVSLLIVFCVARNAYAQPSIEVSGNFAGYEDGEEYKGYVIVDSPNAYTSSIVLIGEYSSLIQIDSVMYSKLSDPVKGGNFYKLTQKWKHIGTNASGTTEYYPNWLAMTHDFADQLNIVYGYDRNWACVVTANEVSDALRDFHKILDGGVAGDDDDDDDDDDDEHPTEDGYTFIKWTEIVDSSNAGDIVGFYTASDTYDRIVSSIDSSSNGYGIYAALGVRTSTSQELQRSIWKYSGTSKPEIITTGLSYDSYAYRAGQSTTTYKYYENERYIYIPLAATMATNAINQTAGTYTTGAPYSAYYWSKEGSGSGGGGDDTPIVPVDPPADPLPTQPSPTAPNPPQLPNPSDPPVVYPSTPTQPDPPDWPQPSIVVPPGERYIEVPSNTSNQDYTPWLRAILLQLQALCEYFGLFADFLADELENHCIHIRDHMTQTIGWLGEYLADYLYDCFASLSDDLDLEFNNLKSYLKVLLNQHHTYLDNLAQWIVDNVNWNYGGGEYDDSNVIYWLKRIWAKQGSGTVNTKPNDPVTNYNVYVTWLGDLFGDISLDLGGLDLSSLMQAIEGLSDVFPFSIPWNIIAVFGLLSANAVTPSFDFTIPATDLFGSYSYEIDMQWLDGAMASVRAIELLAFCCYVLVHTKDLCGFLLGGDD